MGNPLTETGLFRAIEPIAQDAKSTKVLLQGPIGEPNKGMIVRMALIERIIKWIVAGFGLILSACVIAGINRIVNGI